MYRRGCFRGGNERSGEETMVGALQSSLRILLEVVGEKCLGCQTDEANQLGHELCLLASAEEQVKLCFGRVSWDEVLDNWYKKVLEMPIALNPETLAIFRETVNPKDVTYKDRLKKWLIESPTVEV